MGSNKDKNHISGTAIKAFKSVLGKLGDALTKQPSLKTAVHAFSDEEKLLLQSCLFVQSYYEQQCNRTFNEKLDAISHYLAIGSNNTLNPSPLFDGEYYLSKNPDVAKNGSNPLVHFLYFGAGERRNPHKYFDVDFYLMQLSPSSDQNVNALEHFLDHSTDNHTLNPNPNFSVKKYYLQYPEALLAKNNSLVHFLENKEELSTHYQTAFTQEILPEYGKKAESETDFETLVLCSHDANRTGAPLIILKIAELLHTEHHIDCKIILIRGGPLLAEFRKYGELLVLDNGTNQNCTSVASMRLKIANFLNSSTNHALCNSVESNFVINELARHQLKIVSLIHEFTDTYPQNLIDELYQDSNRIIVPSEIVLQSLQSRIDEELTGVEVLPQGIFSDKDYTQPAFDRSKRQSARQRILAELKLPENTQIVLGSGYVDTRKGCDYFMLACQMMKTRYPQLDIAFIWVGQRNAVFANSSFSFWLNTDRIKTGLENHLFFVGEKNDPTDYFLAAEVFFMCSRLDPFPCVVLEALSAATPVVCFDSTTGSAELLTTGAGTIVPPFNLLEATDAIAAYLTDESLREKAGSIGQNLIKTKFKFTDYVGELVHRLEALGFEKPAIRANETEGRGVSAV